MVPLNELGESASAAGTTGVDATRQHRIYEALFCPFMKLFLPYLIISKPTAVGGPGDF
jgi:hypothetical protein